MDSDRGIIYIATGDTLVDQAVESASRVSSLVDLPITIATNVDIDPPHIDTIEHISDPNFDLRDKVENFHRTPYDECLYLDADTWIRDCEAINHLFGLLEKVDIATSMDSARHVEKHVSDGISAPELSPPRSFPEPNTGVVVYDSEACDTLFARWRDIYERHYHLESGINDQGAFHEALYQSDVIHSFFQPEYNFRLIVPHYFRQKVQLLHGRAENFQEIEKKVNSAIEAEGEALYYPISLNPYAERSRIEPLINPGSREIWLRSLSHSLSEYGLSRTVSNLVLGGGTDLKTGFTRTHAIKTSVHDRGVTGTILSAVSWLKGGSFFDDG